MKATELLTDLAGRGIRVTVTADGTYLEVQPASLMTDGDRQMIRAHKPELLGLLALKPAPARGPAAEQKHTEPPCGNRSAPAPATDPDLDAALAIVWQLKAYALPEGRIPAAHGIAERLRPLLAGPELNPSEALAALLVAEGELNGLGGRLDRELAEAIGLINGVFPDARLVKVKKVLQ
jgi:hypothetical protein